MKRLQTRPQFQAALAGRTLAKTPHFALHLCALESALFPAEGVWLGAMVPKRWVKRAVTRNAIRRQIYAVSRELEASLAQCAHVVRLRAGFDREQFVSARSDVLVAAVRGELLQLLGGVPAVVASPVSRKALHVVSVP